MLTSKRHEVILLHFFRIGIGSIFAFSGFQKLMEPYQNFLNIIMSYDLVPVNIAFLMSIILPWAELIIGIFLVLGLWTGFSVLTAAVFNFAFIIAIGSALARDISLKDCGCFGGASFSPKVTLIIDFLMLSASVLMFIFLESAKSFSLDRYFSQTKRS